MLFIIIYMYNMQSRYYMYTNVVRDKQLKRKNIEKSWGQAWLIWPDLSCSLSRSLVTTEKSRWDVEHHTINIKVV